MIDIEATLYYSPEFKQEPHPRNVWCRVYDCIPVKMRSIKSMEPMDDSFKVKLADKINEIYQKSIAKPNDKLKWKAGASMANFVEALQELGVDFSNVKL